MVSGRVPNALISLGILIACEMAAELFLSGPTLGGFDAVAVANFVTSIPFVAVLVGGGYWLANSDIDAERHRRIGVWALAGLGFFGAFFVVIAVFTTESWLVRIGIIRWAVAAGAGIGTLVGLFEARAIHRALAAERIRIRNEELKRQKDRLEEFAGILSHDLRNPLNVATGYLDMLGAERDDERIDRIETAHDRIAEIIDETLLLARSGQAVTETETVSLAGAVERCWENVDTGEATLVVERDGTFDADPKRVQRLFENLFRNSVEHSSTNSRSETDDAVEHDGDGVTVRVGALEDGFYVEDTGEGIPEDIREDVFESGYSTDPDGTGYGLAIVREIAAAHNWTVTATTEEDGGARIEVTGVDVEPVPAVTSGTETAIHS